MTRQADNDAEARTPKSKANVFTSRWAELAFPVRRSNTGRRVGVTITFSKTSKAEREAAAAAAAASAAPAEPPPAKGKKKAKEPDPRIWYTEFDGQELRFTTGEKREIEAPRDSTIEIVCCVPLIPEEHLGTVFVLEPVVHQDQRYWLLFRGLSHMNRLALAKCQRQWVALIPSEGVLKFVWLKPASQVEAPPRLDEPRLESSLQHLAQQLVQAQSVLFERDRLVDQQFAFFLELCRRKLTDQRYRYRRRRGLPIPSEEENLAELLERSIKRASKPRPRRKKATASAVAS